MELIVWLLVGAFALIAFFQFFAATSAYKKLNTLNEYVQFLLFHPEVYNNHREKFLRFVADKSTASSSDQTMASYQMIEDIAIQLQASILLANVASRGRQQDPQ